VDGQDGRPNAVHKYSFALTSSDLLSCDEFAQRTWSLDFTTTITCDKSNAVFMGQ